MTSSIKIRDAAATLRTLTRISMRDETGVLRTIQSVKVRDENNALRQVYVSEPVSLSTYDLYASNSGAASSGTITSPSVTSTVRFGVAPYNYNWIKIDGQAGITVTTPAAANSTFSTFAGGISGQIKAAHYFLRVTDSLGAVRDSKPLFVTLEWIDTR